MNEQRAAFSELSASLQALADAIVELSAAVRRLECIDSGDARPSIDYTVLGRRHARRCDE